LYLGGTGPICNRLTGLIWSYYGKMANTKIFQLLPDVYDMLLGVTNSIVMQDRVAKLNDQGISACMIQGHSVLH
jgi:hypothetical protein